MKWTEEQTIKFVKEYIKHECLYNVNCKGFGVRYARTAALVKLSTCMGIRNFGPKDAHHKLRSLKSTYAQELKKIKEAAGSNYVYVPSLKWFNIFHNAVNPGECKDTKQAETDSPQEVNKTEKESVREHDKLVEEPSPSDSQIKVDTNIYRSPLKIINPRKRMMTDYDNTITEGQNIGNKVHKEETENEFDIFGKSIAAQLKNMPLDRAIESQMFIQNYLSDMRLRALQSISFERIRTTSSQSNEEFIV